MRYVDGIILTNLHIFCDVTSGGGLEKKIWTKEICNLCYLSGKSGCFRSHDNTR